jgi:adenylate cyclase
MDERIAFLVIDQASINLDTVRPEEFAASPLLQQMKGAGWPWPREAYPAIIERLVNAGARVVALDLMFPAPREGDDAFRKALEKHRDRVVIGCNFSEAEREQGTRRLDMAANFGTLQMPSPTLIPPGDGSDPRVGFVNFWPDYGDVVRRARFRTSAGELSGIASAGGAAVFSLTARMLQQAGLGEKIPATSGASIWRFADGIRAHSLYEILVDEIWNSPPYNGGAFFKDKLVLIGPDGNWSKDQVETSIGRISGPELHLNVLNAALKGDFVREPPQWVHVVLVLLGGVIAWLLSFFIRQPMLRFFAFLAGCAGGFGLALLAYDHFPGGTGRLAFYLGPLVSMAGSGFVWLVWEQLLERRERQRTRRTLERYVSKNVVRELLDNPDTFFDTLGGVRRPVAVLFTDLRGFTTLTEKSDSHQLVTQLNEYFSEMVRIVFRNGGTLDKFIGDAVMAVWGNIKSDGPTADVERCITATIEMKFALVKLNESWRGRGMPELALGAGINHGEVIVGNLGSADERHEKMELTVIGDAVNLASRLEGVTKDYGIDIAVGEDAAQQVHERFALLLVDCVKVKGRVKPLDIYTIADPFADTAEEHMKLHNEAVAAYRARDFAKALGLFQKCEAVRPGLALTKIYEERCAEFMKNPPPPGWDGVYVMTHK